MTARTSALALILALVATASPLVQSLRAQAGDNAPAYAFVNGRWFDGTRFVSATYYAVKGVLRVRRPSRVDSTIDLAGRYVVPPFGEAHNHNVEGSRAGDVGRSYLAAGIFYVKNPNSLPEAGRRLAGMVNTPTTVDAVFAGGGLTPPDGHPWDLVQRNIARGIWTESDAEGAFIHSIGNLADLDRKWPTILAQHPDFIKTYLLYSEEYAIRSGDSTYYSWTGLHPDGLTEIVRRAHAAGLRVSTHVETASDFHHAVAAGTDEINHLPGFRLDRDQIAGWAAATYAIAAADAREAALRGIVVVTTVGPTLEFLASDRAAQLPSEIAQAWREVIVENLRTLKDNGVAIALGTDRYQSTDATEANALTGTGVFSNLELLKAWTETTAATIFPDRRIGRLAEGYEASFLVLAGNPLDDFTNTGRIVLRVKQGHLLH